MPDNLGFLFSSIIEYMLVILWIAGILAACRLGGWRLGLVVLTLGLTYGAYRHGRKTERDNQEEWNREIQAKREQAYEEIKNRHTDAADVDQRLRDGSF